MTNATVYRCAHPGCRRLCVGWLCERHRGEAVPEHQRDRENAPEGDLARRGGHTPSGGVAGSEVNHADTVPPRFFSHVTFALKEDY